MFKYTEKKYTGNNLTNYQYIIGRLISQGYSVSNNHHCPVRATSNFNVGHFIFVGENPTKIGLSPKFYNKETYVSTDISDIPFNRRMEDFTIEVLDYEDYWEEVGECSANHYTMVLDQLEWSFFPCWEKLKNGRP